MARPKVNERGRAAIAAALAGEGWEARPTQATEKLIQAAEEWAAEQRKKKPAKERQVSLRMDEDLILVGQHRAAMEGLTGYQSLIKSVFYRYLTGKLIDPDVEARLPREKVK